MSNFFFKQFSFWIADGYFFYVFIFFFVSFFSSQYTHKTIKKESFFFLHHFLFTLRHTNSVFFDRNDKRWRWRKKNSPASSAIMSTFFSIHFPYLFFIDLTKKATALKWIWVKILFLKILLIFNFLTNRWCGVAHLRMKW
jgi:hypothetical protein